MRSIAVIEWLAIGGVSLLAWPFVQFFDIDSLASLPTLILLFSLPHFALSYFLFYSQKGLAREHWIAAYIVPVALLSALFVLGGAPAKMAMFVHVGFFMFFHHIAKQAYGIGLYYSGKPTKHSKLWKYSLLFTALAWGLTTWLEQQSKPGTFMAFKSFITTLELSPEYAVWARRLAIAATVVCVGVWLRIARKTLPSVTLMSWTPLCALIVWCQPQLGLTPLGLMPVLHGFQYMPFAWKKMNREGWRVFVASGVALAAFPIGWALFQGSSSWLLKTGSARADVWVSVLYIFLNVHHYVLDRYMWTRKSFYDREVPAPVEQRESADLAA